MSDSDNQQQDIEQLSQDTDNAHSTLDGEKPVIKTFTNAQSGN
ncbi:hypothetical protein ABN211_02125 [Proteus terrae]|nr:MULTISPECIES: hypothetical protein [Proteus]